MTPRPALALILAGVLGLAASLALVVADVRRYLDGGLAVSSTSGLTVFRVDDALVQYRPFEPGLGPTLALASLVLLLGGLFVAAATRRLPDSPRDT